MCNSNGVLWAADWECKGNEHITAVTPGNKAFQFWYRHFLQHFPPQSRLFLGVSPLHPHISSRKFGKQKVSNLKGRNFPAKMLITFLCNFRTLSSTPILRHHLKAENTLRTESENPDELCSDFSTGDLLESTRRTGPQCGASTS